MSRTPAECRCTGGRKRYRVTVGCLCTRDVQGGAHRSDYSKGLEQDEYPSTADGVECGKGGTSTQHLGRRPSTTHQDTGRTRPKSNTATSRKAPLLSRHVKRSLVHHRTSTTLQPYQLVLVTLSSRRFPNRAPTTRNAEYIAKGQRPKRRQPRPHCRGKKCRRNRPVRPQRSSVPVIPPPIQSSSLRCRIASGSSC